MRSLRSAGTTCPGVLHTHAQASPTTGG